MPVAYVQPASRFEITDAYTMTDRRSDSIADALKLNNGEKFNPDTANDVQRAEVRNAITHMGIVDRFLDWAFDRGRKAEALSNLADMLTHEKPENRADALVWLLENTTDTGKEILLSYLRDMVINIEYERLMEAGCAHMYLKTGLAYMKAKDFQKAGDTYMQAKDFLKAWDAYMKAEAFLKAGDAYTEVKAFLKAGDTYMQAEAFLKAGDAYTEVKAFLKAGDAYTEVKASLKATGDAYMKAKDFLKGGDAYTEVKASQKAAGDAYAKYDAFKDTRYMYYNFLL